MPDFVMLACACIISTVLGWELLNKCGETQFNSDKSLGEMGYVLGEPASVRQNSLRSVAVSLHEHSINPSNIGILTAQRVPSQWSLPQCGHETDWPESQVMTSKNPAG